MWYNVYVIFMLMTLISTLSVISHLTCGNIFFDLWLEMVVNLNLIYETLWTGVGSGLLILML